VRGGQMVSFDCRAYCLDVGNTMIMPMDDL
jgi:hypothetical protein